MVYIETSLKDKWKQNFEVITGIQVQYGMVYIETSLKEKWKQNFEKKKKFKSSIVVGMVYIETSLKYKWKNFEVIIG